MKRHNAIVQLSRDHQKGLMLAQLLKSNAPAYKGLPTDIIGKKYYAKETFELDLKKHFEDEEKILFPYVKGRDPECDKLISELLEEHLFLSQKIFQLSESKNLVNDLDIIGQSLEHHIRKEERILFNRIQNLLNENELEILKNKIELSRKEYLKSCKTKSH
jgi:iron-sulfur cluster repair protein YtfE (RIC family)